VSPVWNRRFQPIGIGQSEDHAIGIVHQALELGVN